MRVENYGDIRRTIKRGTAKSVSYAKTANGALIHLASSGADRPVIITAKVTQLFANGDGAQTTFKIGQTGTDDKFCATSLFTDAALGKVFVLSGVLSSGANLLVTANDASGTGTGALKITSVVFPVNFTD